MEYLLKFILTSAILYGIYYLFLKQERTFHFNRFYLLLIIPIALLVPKLTVKTRYVEVPSAYPQQVQFSQPITINNMVDLPEEAAAVPSTEMASTPFDWQTLIITLFILVSTVLLVRLVINLYRLSAFRNSGEVIKNGEYTLCLRDDIASSFTFLNTIFTNKSEYKAGKLPQEILTHEAIHARQKHSIDIIVMEVLNVLLWFNPVLYLIKQSIKLNHEFLADNGVYAQNNSIPQYQLTLLHYAKINSNNEPVLASRLTYGETKKRLKIMVKSTNKHITRAKVTLALVAIATTTFLLGKERVVAQDSTEELYKIWEEQNSFKYVERADSVELLMVGPFPGPQELVRLTNKDGSVTEKELNELSITERAWLADGQSKAQFLDSKNNQWTAIGAIDRMKRWDASKPADRSLLNRSTQKTELPPPAPYYLTVEGSALVRFKNSNNNWVTKKYTDLSIEDRLLLNYIGTERFAVIPPPEQMEIRTSFINELSTNNKYEVWVNQSLIKNEELSTYDKEKFHHYYRVDVRQKADYPGIDFVIVFKTKDYWANASESKGTLVPFEKGTRSLNPSSIVKYTDEKGNSVKMKFSELSEEDQAKFKAGEFKGSQLFLPPPPPAFISQEMLDEFSNGEKYEVLVDEKAIAAKDLSRFDPSDFYLFLKTSVEDSKKIRVRFTTKEEWNKLEISEGKWIDYVVIKDKKGSKKGSNSQGYKKGDGIPKEHLAKIDTSKVEYYLAPTKSTHLKMTLPNGKVVVKTYGEMSDIEFYHWQDPDYEGMLFNPPKPANEVTREELYDWTTQEDLYQVVVDNKMIDNNELNDFGFYDFYNVEFEDLDYDRTRVILTSNAKFLTPEYYSSAWVSRIRYKKAD